ncbi:MAG TPA: enoyl-CoA hydratase/isomerase family protein [Quisquiliibacterium sp.]|nr:enoyl-CoA hydratase/isomerase family protein [Quisquiliibacterium sp.]HPA90437.1 enoyl-CoA hydratase/isomerase family protein [Quisquiliibacterium sp.]HQN11942.1 enoyl-CoA hydratase/isomerase family protein [Quisquiliibacterium sp.]HQP66183.1 enoyl-CoA hydratase/isomerase family protein [Quisquiliibacterium sp.]
MSFVKIERHGRIAIVRFDRQDRANALSIAACRALTDAARSFENDPDVCAVILTGTATNFSNGADLKDPERLDPQTSRLSERRLQLQTGGKLCRAWEEIEAITIAAVEGWCVGGGAALVAACDLRVAAENSHFYVPEIERGMNLQWGAVPRITHLVGPARAKRIAILSEKLPAARALDWGFVDELAAPGKSVEVAMALAERCASMPPVQVRMIKQAVNASAFALDRAVSHADFDQFALAAASADYAEGVRSFLEKRPPRYTGG